MEYDDIIIQIQEAVKYKREGDFDKANAIYKSLNENSPNNPMILKSWAKIMVCSGNYNQATKLYQKSSDLYKKSGNGEYWQCDEQINDIKNRFDDPEKFKNWVRAVSGGSVTNASLESKDLPEGEDEDGDIIKSQIYPTKEQVEYLSEDNNEDDKSFDDMIWEAFEPEFIDWTKVIVRKSVDDVLRFKAKDPSLITEQYIDENFPIYTAVEAFLWDDKMKHNVYVRVEKMMEEYLQSKSPTTKVTGLKLKEEGIIKKMEDFFERINIRDQMYKTVRSEIIRFVNFRLERN